ncbi:hypothetical protein KIP88_03045 [Bradyrhizobium sp. SRL28]|uniref:hypothetical protein n=1 Tax=Bradyrhizobium sp. SRL28 TaxID=2836178 RepID=UPI001BDF4050|nr:hypothetical protein [Bradyrhizobium sp. SRL28]MBT1509469.1 hypothetical protein [Bradyrhizobium sp. SRL28]
MDVITATDAELDDLYERTKLDHEIIVGSEIRILIAEIRYHRRHEAELQEQLRIAQRLERIDTSLAKRLGDHIARDSELKGWLQNWLNAYSTTIFPEPDLKKATEVLKANDMTIDSLSAEMGRHILTRVIEHISRE